MDDSTDVGARVRQLRRGAALTMQQVAERAGLSRMTVAQIESGAVNPTVGSVARIARALGVPVGRLFAPDEPTASATTAGPGSAEQEPGYAIDVIHPDDRRQYVWRAKHFEYDILVPDHRPVQVHLMRFRAGTSIPFEEHGGHEVAIVISGRYEVIAGEQVIHAEAGDSLYIADSPDVTVRCLADGEIYWVAAALGS